MPAPVPEPPAVTLVVVDADVPERLVTAATGDAAADEVTPPLTAGVTWTPERVAWLRRYHLDRRVGVDGPDAEVTRVVLVADDVVGAVRWKRTPEPDAWEVGIWLRRSARGRGVARAAVAATVREAAALGAALVVANTDATNSGALAVLRALGFHLAAADERGRVRAQLAVAAGPRPPG